MILNAKKPEVFFRADANSTIGLGHLTRLIALAEIIQSQFNCFFFVRESNEIIHNQVASRNFDFQLLDDDVSFLFEANLIKERVPRGSVIVLDGYNFGNSYFKTLSESGLKVVLVDDFNANSEHLFAVINHCIGKDPRGLSTNKYFYGAKYAILRPSFLSLARKNQRNLTKSKVFICFGGADKENLTKKVMSALECINYSFEINVVLAGTFPFTESIKNFKQTAKQKIVIHKNLPEKEIAQLMDDCDLAFTPTSNLAYELCCARTIIFGGYFVDNQKSIHDGLVQANCIISLGNLLFVSLETVQNQVIYVLNNQLTINKLLSSQEKHFDGTSDARITAVFHDLFERR
jgi:UDP-2,4-diacetamido-2,4,6-trideoxy-beta-L-altropyranose hydrolase